ncbi:MAG: Spy/CpxP family protein refolding chaperone [Devosia sp.]
MKYLTTTAIAALLVGTVAALSLVPAQADDTTPAAPAVGAPAAPAASENVAKTDEPNLAGPGMRGHGGPGGWNRGGSMRSNILNIACGDRGAEALEIAFIHVQYGVKPTTAQQPLFDALKTSALADQKTFADACKSAMDQKTGDAQKPSILDRLETRVTIENAKVTALNDVLPKFKAFYDSLTDEQKAKLEPRQGGPRVGFNQMWGHPGWGHFGPGRFGHQHRPQAPDTQQGPDSHANPADNEDASPT